MRDDIEDVNRYIIPYDGYQGKSTFERETQEEEFKAKLKQAYDDLVLEEEALCDDPACGLCNGELDDELDKDFGGAKPDDFKQVYDSVNKPLHYNSYKNIEVIQLTSQLDFCRGNAVKYIARAGLKDKSKELEDLEKARWYVDYAIKMLKEGLDD